jgi:hypothetical protein
MTEIKRLNENKTVIFNCPVLKEVLVRTGVNPLKNSLIQCILLSTDRLYLKEINKRDNIYSQLCNKLCNVKSLRTNVLKVFNDFYDNITKDQKINSVSNEDINQVFLIIFELVGFSEFKDIIKSNYPNVQTYRENILESVSILVTNCLKDLDIDNNRKQYCVEKSKELFNNIYRYCEKIELSEENILDYYSDLNIIFIDSRTKLPLKNSISNKDSIILLKYTNDTYEVVGKLFKDNVVKRLFSPDDIICKKLVTEKQNDRRSSDDRRKRSSSSSSDDRRKRSSPDDRRKTKTKTKTINLFRSSSTEN